MWLREYFLDRFDVTSLSEGIDWVKSGSTNGHEALSARIRYVISAHADSHPEACKKLIDAVKVSDQSILVFLVEQWSLSSPEDALKCAASAGFHDHEAVRIAAMGVLRAWVDAEPSEALRWLRSWALPLRETSDYRLSVWDWLNAESVPSGASGSLDPEASRFSSLCALDPRYLEILLSLEPDQTNRALAQAVTQALLGVGRMSDVVELADSEIAPESTRTAAGALLLDYLAKHDPQTGVRWLVDRGFDTDFESMSEGRKSIVHAFALSMVASDEDLATESALEMPQGSVLSEIIFQKVGEQAASRGAEEFAAFVDSIPRERTELVDAATCRGVIHLARVDPSLALDLIDLIADDNAREQSAMGIYFRWGYEDLDGAVSWISAQDVPYPDRALIDTLRGALSAAEGAEHGSRSMLEGLDLDGFGDQLLEEAFEVVVHSDRVSNTDKERIVLAVRDQTKRDRLLAQLGSGGEPGERKPRSD